MARMIGHPTREVPPFLSACRPAGNPHGACSHARMPERPCLRRVENIMVARDVEQAAAELRALRHEEWGRTGLVVLFFALAVAASATLPSLAVPLLVGALTAVVLAIRVFWRRWDLLDRLLLERDAYTI